MNNIDFTSPNGFPLEADATLGSMQNNYVTGLQGVGAFFGDATIVSGLEINGSALTDGWIYMSGDLIFFQGGAPVDSFYIETTIVQRANENGVLDDRYFTKKAKFGTHPTLTNYSFAVLSRLSTQKVLQSTFLGFFQLEAQVVIKGCVVSIDSGGTTFSISTGLVVLDGEILAAPPINGVSGSKYLVKDNTLPNQAKYIDTPTTSNIEFVNTGCSQYYSDIQRRNAALQGEIRMTAINPAYFDSSGLGIIKFKGWAICNGNNGTFNMSGKSPVGLDLTDTDFNALGNHGGAKTVVLDNGNLPSHNHTFGDTNGSLLPGATGLIRKSVAGEAKTIGAGAVDSEDSGVQADIVSSPVNIPYQGNNDPFSIMSPYVTLLFIQRI